METKFHNIIPQKNANGIHQSIKTSMLNNLTYEFDIRNKKNNKIIPIPTEDKIAINKSCWRSKFFFARMICCANESVVT